MINKEQLRIYAGKLMFDMNDEEYETLAQEFDIILKQMDLIGNIEGIEYAEPMTFPYEIGHATFREDNVTDELKIEEILQNVKETEKDQIRVPKVVE